MSKFTIQTIHGQRVLSDNDRRNTLPANNDEQERESREFLERVKEEKEKCLQSI